MDESGIQQGLHDHGNATHAVDVVHDVPAEGLEVSDVRNLVVDAIEVVERELDISFVSNRKQVQNGVGRTTECHQHGNRVFECLLRHDVAGGDALRNQVDDGLTRAVRVVVATTIRAGRSCRAGKAHAKRFSNRRHSVRRVHSATRTLAGADGLLNTREVFDAHLAGLAGTDGFERVNDCDALLGSVRKSHPAGCNGSGVEEYAREVETSGSHEHAGK